MLFVLRKINLRHDDFPPKPYEIFIPLIVWAFVFESVAPYTKTYHGLAFGDPLDILCYVSGALIAAIFWRFHYASRATSFS